MFGLLFYNQLASGYTVGGLDAHDIDARSEVGKVDVEVLAAVAGGVHHGLTHGVDEGDVVDDGIGFEHYALASGVGVEAEGGVVGCFANAEGVAEIVALSGVEHLAVVDVGAVVVVDESDDFAVAIFKVGGQGVGEGVGESHVAAFYADGVAPHVGDSVADRCHVPVVDGIIVGRHAVVVVVLLHEDRVFDHKDDEAGVVVVYRVAKAAADGAGDGAGGGVVGDCGGVDLARSGHVLGLGKEGADGRHLAYVGHGTCVGAVEAGAVQHHGGCESAAAVEDGESLVDRVGDAVGAKAGVVLDPDHVVVAADGVVDAVGAGRTVAALGCGELLDKYFSGKELLVVLSRGYKRCEQQNCR